MKVYTVFTMFTPSKLLPQSVIASALLIILGVALSGCPSQTVGQSVNITIDKQLLEQVTGVTPPPPPPGTSTPSDNVPPSSAPIPSPSPPQDHQGADDEFFDEVLDDETEAMFNVVYDVADGLNDWDIYTFSNALHPNSAFAANMPLFFNQLVEAGTTHQINYVTLKEKTDNSATLRVNRYSTAFGSGKTEDLYYDLLKVNTEWKLLHIRSADGSF